MAPPPRDQIREYRILVPTGDHPRSKAVGTVLVGEWRESTRETEFPGVAAQSVTEINLSFVTSYYMGQNSSPLCS